MNVSRALDLISILTGLIGSLLNALLFYVIGRNTTIDKKCALVYQNLAAVDIFNCFVIPMCYLSVKGHGYNFDLHNKSDSILYLLFGGTIEVPYMLLILLSVARVMIFKNPRLYANKMSILSLKVVMLACWILAIGSGVGIWLCFLLSGTARRNHLLNLMKIQGVSTIVLIIGCIALITTSLAMLNTLTSSINDKAVDKIGNKAADKVGNKADDKVCESRSGTHVYENKPHIIISDETSDRQRIINETLPPPPSVPILHSTNNILKEISSARRTLSYFFVSVLIWSSFPFVFALSFSVCGPDYNSTLPVCQVLQNPILSDPKLSYAITLLFLCGLSIANAVILLRQRSFKNVIYSLRIFKPRCSGEQAVIPVVGSDNVLRANKDATPLSFYGSPEDTMRTPGTEEKTGRS